MPPLQKARSLAKPMPSAQTRTRPEPKTTQIVTAKQQQQKRLSDQL